jgi:hypothetical protein
MRQLLFFFLIASITAANGQNPKVQSTQNARNSSKLQNEISNSPFYSFKIIYSLDNTWGYDILKDNKMLIHQTSIPSIGGNGGFKSKSDAEKVAQLVIEKLKKGDMPPSVTKVELNSLKVL